MKVLTCAQVKTAEDNAVKNGIFSYAQLMKNAGEGAAKIIVERFPISGKHICVLAGCGNNGGDGLVIASELRKLGAKVRLLLPFGSPATDTAMCFSEVASQILVLDDFAGEFDIVIDALFGIGLNRILSGEIAGLIEKINAYDCVKIAIDVPSGVFCDGGTVACAFKADLTISFSCYKLCNLLPQTSEYCGEVIVCDIGIPLNDYAYTTIEAPIKKKRPKNSHKGTFGSALLFCGSYGMCGAAILAARAALRSGVGILKALVCDKNYAAFTLSVPEAVTIPVPTTQSGAPDVYDKIILSSISSSSAMLIGCGLGTSDDAAKLIRRTLEITNIPTVVDADGINIVSKSINLIRNIKAPLILTPHPKEMARLCGTTAEDIESNRVKYAKKFAAENRCVLVLKGANTVVAAPDGRIYFNTTGNSGLATGGSGDVLSGMIVSRLAQGYEPLEAALSSVWLHGKAADSVAQKMCERAIIPSDIIEELKVISD